MEELVVIDKPNAAFWKDRDVMITGHTGFKGSWLVMWLHQLGARIHGFSYPPPTTPSMFESLELAELLASDVRGNVGIEGEFEKALKNSKATVVFHLAAQPVVRTGYEDPIETIRSNTMGTVYVLDALRSCPHVQSTIIVTTDKVYRNNEWRWGYRENEALGGHDPYSASKAAADILTTSYKLSFFQEGNQGLVTVRAGNVLGGGSWSPFGLVPDTILAFSQGKTVDLRMPWATRPWQHVLDPLRGYIRLAEAAAKSPKDWSEAFNLGPDQGSVVSVETVVQQIADLWGDGVGYRDTSSDSQHHEAGLLSLDSTAVRQRLGWAPRIDLATCLEMVVTWYKAFYAKSSAQSMRALTLQQIDRHMEQT